MISPDRNTETTAAVVGAGVVPYVGADGLLQDSVPVVDDVVVLRVDQQLCSLPDLQLEPAEKRNVQLSNVSLRPLTSKNKKQFM